MHTTIVRTLKWEYRIRTQSREVAELMAFVDTRPEMVGFELETLELSVESDSDRHSLALPDGTIAEGTALDIIDGVARVVYLGIEVEEPAAPLIHGASVVIGGQKVLLVGVAGFGKTTLTMHLLANGIDVEGDEHIVVREQDVVARPRPLRVKSASIALLPKLAAAVLASPSLLVREGDRTYSVYSVAPSITGRPWRIAAGRADHVVFLEPNHGGKSELAPLPREAAFGRLMEDCLLPGGNHGTAVARVRRAAAESCTWLLRLGDLAEAEWLIRNLP